MREVGHKHSAAGEEKAPNGEMDYAEQLAHAAVGKKDVPYAVRKAPVVGVVAVQAVHEHGYQTTDGYWCSVVEVQLEGRIVYGSGLEFHIHCRIPVAEQSAQILRK